MAIMYLSALRVLFREHLASIKARKEVEIRRHKGRLGYDSFVSVQAQETDISPKHHGTGLLDLPVELILLIADHLPCENRILLANSCRSTRAILYRIADKSHELSHNDRVEYLSVLARSMPDKWVCEICTKLHGLNVRDLPQAQLEPCLSAFLRPGLGNQKPGSSYTLYHRHIQLALKYSRIDNTRPKQERWLRSMMAPYVRYADTGGLRYACAIRPRIIDGRFMIQTVRRWQTVKEKVTRESIGPVRVCQHQRVDLANDCSCHLSRQSMHGLPMLYPRTASKPLQSSSALRECTETAFQSPQHRVFGACKKCPTDFVVVVASNDVVIRSWMDLGGEGAPNDDEWTVFSTSCAEQEMLRVEIPHQTGCIMRMYLEDVAQRGRDQVC